MSDDAAAKLTDTGEAGSIETVPSGVEWRRGGYQISTDPARLDIPDTAAYLATTYWAEGRPESIVRRSIEGSIAFGVYDGEEQVGFARVVTDRATFVWGLRRLHPRRPSGSRPGDVAHALRAGAPELQDLRRWLLASTSARGLYERLGFTPLPAPERFMQIDTRASAGGAVTTGSADPPR